MTKRLMIGGNAHGEIVDTTETSALRWAPEDGSPAGEITYTAERFRVLDVPGIAPGEYLLLVHGRGHTVDLICEAIAKSDLQPVSAGV